MEEKAQGAIEYLLIIGAAILVVVIVIIAMTGLLNTANTDKVQDNVTDAWQNLWSVYTGQKTTP